MSTAFVTGPDPTPTRSHLNDDDMDTTSTSTSSAPVTSTERRKAYYVAQSAYVRRDDAEIEYPIKHGLSTFRMGITVHDGCFSCVRWCAYYASMSCVVCVHNLIRTYGRVALTCTHMFISLVVHTLIH